jgi:hypothetical protein
MTEPSGLTPEQDAVRRLLADARHDGSTPPEVVARLDETLASLVAERDGAPLPGDGPAPAPVVDLGARRRRTVGLALLAAAAVVVAGVAVGQGLPRMSGGQSDSAAGGGADTATSQDRELADGSDSGAGSAEQSPEALKGTSVAPKASYPTLSSTDPGLDDELLDLRATTNAAAAEPGPARTLGDCDLQGIGGGRRVAAQVDGSSGVVVFRRPDGATQQVELYLCGTPAPVRMLTLPAP